MSLPGLQCCDASSFRFYFTGDAFFPRALQLIREAESYILIDSVLLIDDAKSQQVHGAIGKIKGISPSNKEQVQSLKDYNGILAANFTFEESGKYGVICLFKVNDQKKLFKFWYPHHG